MVWSNLINLQILSVNGKIIVTSYIPWNVSSFHYWLLLPEHREKPRNLKKHQLGFFLPSIRIQSILSWEMEMWRWCGNVVLSSQFFGLPSPFQPISSQRYISISQELQKIFRFSNVFREYKILTLGRNRVSPFKILTYIFWTQKDCRFGKFW